MGFVKILIAIFPVRTKPRANNGTHKPIMKVTNMVINIVKGRRYRNLRCLSCSRELITRQKRAKIDNKTYCLKCALAFMNNSIVFHKKKIVELRKLKRRIRPKDLVIEVL